MEKVESFTGYCPFIDDERTISVEFSSLRRVRNSADAWKRGALICEDIEDCNYYDRIKKCELYHRATDTLI